MQFTRHPWPLSEISLEEADQILALASKQRDTRINQLKRDIASGAHARRLRHEQLDRERQE